MKKHLPLLFFSLVLVGCFFSSQDSTAQATKPATNITSLPQVPAPNLKLNDPLPANLFVEDRKSVV